MSCRFEHSTDEASTGGMEVASTGPKHIPALQGQLLILMLVFTVAACGALKLLVPQVHLPPGLFKVSHTISTHTHSAYY